MVWDGFPEEPQGRLGELFSGCVEPVAGPVAGNVLVHYCPQALNRVQVRTTGRQLDQLDAAIGARRECPHVWSFVVGSVVPGDVDAVLFGVSGLDFSQQLHRTFAIERDRFNDRFDEGCIEGFQVHRTVDVDPVAPGGGLHRRVRACADPAVTGLRLVFGMGGVGETDLLARGQAIQQIFIKCDEPRLFFRRCNPGQPGATPWACGIRTLIAPAAGCSPNANTGSRRSC